MTLLLFVTARQAFHRNAHRGDDSGHDEAAAALRPRGDFARLTDRKQGGARLPYR
jgi:hypothetical protein